MTILKNQTAAFGHPGIEPRWTRSDKDGVGTAYSASSPIWFTVSAGIVNEVYFPTIDRPQIRDFQFLISDGETFFHDERRNTVTRTEKLSAHSLGYRIVNQDDEGRYRIEKQIIAAPHAACLLVRTRLVPGDGWRGRLKLYALLAPHLDGGGWGNNGHVAQRQEQEILVATKNEVWLAMGASKSFVHGSCGFVGASDGWSDLNDNLQLDWDFDEALDGNIALVGEIDLSDSLEFTIAVAFGDRLHGAMTTLIQSLATPFEDHSRKFQAQWQRVCERALPLDEASTDNGRLYRNSHSLLLAHEDKTYHGAMIASLSIPWGDHKGDEDLGGYHLVWTRDMVSSALGLLASGNLETPFRALVYLAATQRPDGGFHQNFWIDGSPYWTGVQLDEVAFPILLAWRLSEANALQEFDPWPMVLSAAAYLIRQGPATPQERWEENGGYSPSTLATNIAALTCAALFAHQKGDEMLATFLHQYADFLECHVERWTVTTEGTLDERFPRHYIRIHPVDPGNSRPDENPNHGLLAVRNQPPGAPFEFPANRIVDGGFLELVRYGIRPAGDPLIEDSLQVVDQVLRFETPGGPCWHRYNHDGYGQRDDGGPFDGFGIGRGWPLLTGERAHYELAAGRDVTSYIRAMEYFANSTGLLPEQIWDQPDRPEWHMLLGRPTGAAMPLMWAHAEYIKLLRSVSDGQVFDRIEAVADRYLERRACQPLEIWKFNRQPQTVRAGELLRIQAAAPFRLRWTDDGWSGRDDRQSSATTLAIHFADIGPFERAGSRIEFTFFWTDVNRWEGGNFAVEVV